MHTACHDNCGDLVQLLEGGLHKAYACLSRAYHEERKAFESKKINEKVHGLVLRYKSRGQKGHYNVQTRYVI